MRLCYHIEMHCGLGMQPHCCLIADFGEPEALLSLNSFALTYVVDGSEITLLGLLLGSIGSVIQHRCDATQVE